MAEPPILEIKHGAPFAVPATVTQNGAPVNLTGVTIASQVRTSPTGPLVFAFVVRVVNALAGQISMELVAPLLPSVVPAGTYFYDIRFTWPDGRLSFSPIEPVRVAPAVTYE